MDASFSITMALLMAFFFPFVLADQNHTQIDLNGKLNTLRDEWHRDNVVLWLLPFVAVAYLAFGFSLAAGAYLVLARAWHWVAFDGELNELRGLEEDYVSATKDGAWSDRFLTKYARWKTPIKLGTLSVAAVLFTLTLVYSL